MVGTVIVSQGKVVRPSQLIASVGRTEESSGMARRLWRTAAQVGVVVLLMFGWRTPPGNAALGVAQAKRPAPPAVTPIEHEGTRYAVAVFPGASSMPERGGFVQAWDVASNKLLWTRMVYQTRYEPGLESDVQDVHITALDLVGGKLVVTNELGERFEMNLASGEIVARLKKSSRTSVAAKSAPER